VLGDAAGDDVANLGAELAEWRLDWVWKAGFDALQGGVVERDDAFDAVFDLTESVSDPVLELFGLVVDLLPSRADELVELLSAGVGSGADLLAGLPGLLLDLLSGDGGEADRGVYGVFGDFLDVH
jgi:hypothetical protein